MLEIIDAEREFGISLAAHFVKYAYIRCTSKGDINEKALVYSAEELVGKDVTVINEYSV